MSDVRRLIKINDIETTCNKFYFDKERGIVNIYGTDIELKTGQKISFEYEKEYFVGKGTIIYRHESDVWTKYTYEVKVTI